MLWIFVIFVALFVIEEVAKVIINALFGRES
jgi:hypothetical protein